MWDPVRIRFLAIALRTQYTTEADWQRNQVVIDLTGEIYWVVIESLGAIGDIAARAVVRDVGGSGTSVSDHPEQPENHY
jgi:hypothetical protein